MDDDEMEAAMEALDETNFVQPNKIQKRSVQNLGLHNEDLSTQTSQARGTQNRKQTVPVIKGSPEKRTNITININVNTSAEKKPRQKSSLELQNGGQVPINVNSSLSHGQQKLDNYFTKTSNKPTDNKGGVPKVPERTTNRNMLMLNLTSATPPVKADPVSTVRVKQEMSLNPTGVPRGESISKWNSTTHTKQESLSSHTDEIGKNTGSLNYVTSVDLWSNIIAMEYPSPHILHLYIAPF